MRFKLDVDGIDADRYLPPAAEGEAPPPATPSAAAGGAAGLPVGPVVGLQIGYTILAALSHLAPQPQHGLTLPLISYGNKEMKKLIKESLY